MLPRPPKIEEDSQPSSGKMQQALEKKTAHQEQLSKLEFNDGKPSTLVS